MADEKKPEEIAGMLDNLMDLVNQYKVKIDELQSENDSMSTILMAYGLIEAPHIEMIKAI